jgi:hypothetical protein
MLYDGDWWSSLIAFDPERSLEIAFRFNGEGRKPTSERLSQTLSAEHPSLGNPTQRHGVQGARAE